MMIGTFGFCGAWTATPETRELLEDLLIAIGPLSDKEACGLLDSPPSHFSEMKSMATAGPGILRWTMNPQFWVRFIQARARRVGLVVIEDVRIAMALGPQLRMVKADLPEYRKERAG